MNAVREFPPNPHALVVHTDSLVTDEIVETYLAGSPAPPVVWIRAVLALAGVRVLSLNAYKVRLQKQKGARWDGIMRPFERILCDGLDIKQLSDLVEVESRSRRFAWHGRPLARCVYEGKQQALENPLAGDLFAILGVAEVILDGHEIEVCKCPLRAWREMAPAIARRLANVSDARDPGH
jgi:hypothetical protein